MACQDSLANPRRDWRAGDLFFNYFLKYIFKLQEVQWFSSFFLVIFNKFSLKVVFVHLCICLKLVCNLFLFIFKLECVQCKIIEIHEKIINITWFTTEMYDNLRLLFYEKNFQSHHHKMQKIWGILLKD